MASLLRACRGRHTLLDLTKLQLVGPKTKARSWLRDCFASHIQAAGPTIVHNTTRPMFSRGREIGFSQAFLLDESHAAIHICEESGTAALDVFTCGSSDPTLIRDGLLADLKLACPQVEVVSSSLVPRFAPASDPDQPITTITSAPATAQANTHIFFDFIGYFPEAQVGDPGAGSWLSELMCRSLHQSMPSNTAQPHNHLVSLDGTDSPPGFTALCIQDGSHVTAHCYSDMGLLAMDVFIGSHGNARYIYEAIAHEMARIPTLEMVSRSHTRRLLPTHLANDDDTVRTQEPQMMMQQ